MTQSKKSLVFLMGIIIMLVLINSVHAITGSMGNARMVLYPEVNGWFSTTIEKSILVKNVNEEEIKITLEVDETGKEFLEVLDTEFTLQPGEEKKANFIVKVKKEGTYEGKINVFFSSLDEKGAGVALASTIIVIAKKDQGYDDSEKDKENLGEDEELVNSTTGEVIENNKSSFSKGQLFLVLSTTLLLIILIFLIVIMKNKKRDSKKGGKLNGKKKS